MRSKPPAWLWAVPVFSCGLLAAVPPFILALKLRTRSAWAWSAAFAVVTVGTYALLGSQPTGADNLATSTGSLLALVGLVGAPIYSTVVGKQVDWGPAPGTPGPTPRIDPNAAAVQQVHAARRRRAEALALAGRDPQMARDLRIGRPDLPRQYDDGGLVDVNHAPRGVIVQWLGLDEAQAARLVQVRDELDGFRHLDDLMTLGGLDLDDFERVRYRVVLL
jgi:hypothetical protein